MAGEPSVGMMPGKAQAAAEARVQMFSLASVVAVSTMGSHQVLHDRFYMGDPVRMAGARVRGHDAQILQYAQKDRAFAPEGRDGLLA